VFDRGKAERMLYLLDTNVFSRPHAHRLTKLLRQAKSVDEVADDAHTPPMPSVTLRSAAQGELVRALVNATADLPARELHLTSPNLLHVFERVVDRVLPHDPLAKARFRGVIAMRQVVGADGGTLSSQQVADLLHITRQGVDKRRRAGRLLAVEAPKRGHLYFAWQFTDAGQELPGLVEVLKALEEHDPWAQARFFLSGNARLRGKRPLDLLRGGAGNLDRVLLAAGAFAQHGGA
jgi:hypothetical protein